MAAFHLHRKTCSILDSAQLLGFLEHIGTYLPWFRHLYGNIRESFNDALRKSSANIELTDAYISCLHSIKHLEGTDLQYHINNSHRLMVIENTNLTTAQGFKVA